MENKTNEEIREAIRETYGKVARVSTIASGISETASCCGTSESTEENAQETSCCGSGQELTQDQISAAIGYSKEELASVPQGANLGLGCGNPVALASLKTGETVVDLGSGGGFDCFLAAKTVGNSGKVIGVDMTPDMVSKARKNADKVGATNVAFRLGEIEHLPVADNTADIVMSNCVINLSPDKPSVYEEAFRVLKPGGRLAISDIVATAELPEDVQQNLALVSACVGGAATIDNTVETLANAGFENITVTPKDESRELIRKWAPGNNAGDYVVSAYIEAVKPL